MGLQAELTHHIVRETASKVGVVCTLNFGSFFIFDACKYYRGFRELCSKMRKSKLLSHRFSGFALAASLGLVACLAYLVDHRILAKQREQQAAYYARALMSDLERTLDLARALAAHVSVNPQIVQDELSVYANAALQSRDLSIKPMSIQLAPNGIVSYEYPWTGGPHIGHDLFNDPTRKAEAIAAAETFSTIVAGPFDLIQGGKALIARHPVIISGNGGENELWGLATLLIDWETVADRVYEIEERLGLSIGLSREFEGQKRSIGVDIPNSEFDETEFFRAVMEPGDLVFSMVHDIYPGWIFYTLFLTLSSALGLTFLVARNETKHKAAQEALAKANIFLESNVNAYVVQDDNWDYVFASQPFLKMLGVSSLDQVPPSPKLFPGLSKQEIKKLRDEWANRTVSDVAQHPSILTLRTPSGEELSVKRFARRFPNFDGDGYLTLVAIEDVTELVNTQTHLQNLVDHDELTGLFSRRGMKAQIEEFTAVQDACIYIIDMDQFKSVNDIYGQDLGDNLLKAIARTLRLSTNDTGYAVRLGGEEFALIRPWKGWADAKDFAERLRQDISGTELPYEGRMVSRTASIGYAELPSSANFSERMNMADKAQQEAKALGGNKCVAADKKLIEEMVARGVFIRTEDIQNALLNGELRFFVQPIWNIQKKSIEGFEALIRWLRPNGEIVMPDTFVDVLKTVERDPKYREMMYKLRANTLAALSNFPDQYVCFNYSLDQIAFNGAAGAADQIHNHLKGILDHPKRQLVIELSEKALVTREDENALIQELNKLRSFGYLIALDDFGIQASNLQRLKDYPIDIVKIDKLLVDTIATSEKSRNILLSIAHFLHELHLSVKVEGVETKEQARILLEANLVSQQGYLHARPGPPEDVNNQTCQNGSDISFPKSSSDDYMNTSPNGKARRGSRRTEGGPG